MRRLEISQKDIHHRFQRISTGTPLECCLGPRNEIVGIGGNLVNRGGAGGGCFGVNVPPAPQNSQPIPDLV